MIIRKRTGNLAPYEPEKIQRAILAAFNSLSEPVDPAQAQLAAQTVTAAITPEVTRRAEAGDPMGVEEIQDLVEEGLIAQRQHQAVRHFILYRTKHAAFRKQLEQFAALFPDPASPIAAACLLEIRRIQREWDETIYPAIQLLHKFTSFRKAAMTEADTLKSLIRAALELTSKEAPDWEFAASALLSIQLRADLAAERHAAGHTQLSADGAPSHRSQPLRRVSAGTLYPGGFGGAGYCDGHGAGPIAHIQRTGFAGEAVSREDR